jgi:hypothetical protein
MTDALQTSRGCHIARIPHGTDREVPPAGAEGDAPVTAAAGLEEDEWSMLRRKALDQLDRPR